MANEILGQQRILRYGKTRAGLSGPKRSDTVVAVTTKDPRQRTRSGVGVGSKEKAVKNRIESPASAEYLPYAARRDTRRWGRGAEHRHPALGLVVDRLSAGEGYRPFGSPNGGRRGVSVDHRGYARRHVASRLRFVVQASRVRQSQTCTRLACANGRDACSPLARAQTKGAAV